MAYFPMFIELEGQNVLIVGGGRMALAKAEKLTDYGPMITVIAPWFHPKLAIMPGLTRILRPFEDEDIREDYALVIAATEDDNLNRMIAAQCRRHRIPVNVVDTQNECSFIFPSLVRRGPLSIGISTGGASPAAAVWIKKEIDKTLPDSIESILLWLRALREPVRQTTQNEAQRKDLFQKLMAEALRLDRPLTKEETAQFIQLS